MAAEQTRMNQPLVNGQNEGNSDRDTVGDEREKQQWEQQQDLRRPPPHLNWPRQQRPPDQRGFNPQNRPPPPGGIRRASPWSLLKARIPEQPVGSEHAIFRMQNPEENRPGSGMMPRGPTGMMPRQGPPQQPQMSRPPSQQDMRPYLQRSDSRTGNMGMQPQPRPMSRPPSSMRSLDDDDDVVIRPGSGMRPPMQTPPASPRPPTPVMRPQVPVPPGTQNQIRPPPPSNSTPIHQAPPSPHNQQVVSQPASPSPQPTQPAPASPITRNSPLQHNGRQYSLSSTPEITETPKQPQTPVKPPTVASPQVLPTPSPTPPNPTTTQPQPKPQPQVKDEKPVPTPPLPEEPPKKNEPTLNGDVKPNEKVPVVAETVDVTPKRPQELVKTEKAETHTPEPKAAATPEPGPKKSNAVVNGSQDNDKKSPTKSVPKKNQLLKSPIKASPKTPDTPGTADNKKNTQSEIGAHTEHSILTKHSNSHLKAERAGLSRPRVRIQEPIEIIDKHKRKMSSQLNFEPTIETSDRSSVQPRKLFKQDSQDSNSETKPIKLPMNKIQVGAAPSPNLKAVKSKIGSLDNASHKPGGGQVKIEHRKLQFNAGSRIEAKNETYTPGGGEKKITHVKLQWNAKPKIGSLENASHKPGGGAKKIESVKLDFKDKAKPKVGSKDNIKHVPGGGTVKSTVEAQEGQPTDIEEQKLDIKATSKIGSLENVKHKPGGGEIKIFDDKEYIRQMTGSGSDVHSASNQAKSSSRRSSRTRLSGSKSGTRENLTEIQSPEKPPTKPIDQNSNQLSQTAGKPPAKERPPIDVKSDANGNGARKAPDASQADASKPPPVPTKPTDQPKPPTDSPKPIAPEKPAADLQPNISKNEPVK